MVWVEKWAGEVGGKVGWHGRMVGVVLCTPHRALLHSPRAEMQAVGVCLIVALCVALVAGEKPQLVTTFTSSARVTLLQSTNIPGYEKVVNYNGTYRMDTPEQHLSKYVQEAV